jgi:hypothetical protein
MTGDAITISTSALKTKSIVVYDKRVSPAVAARFDYFYDELVQTLAEGDPAKLGKDCPGPVALA